MDTSTNINYALRVTLNDQVDIQESYVEYESLVKKIQKWLKPIKYVFSYEIGKKTKKKHLQGYVLLKQIKKNTAISNWFIRNFYKGQYSFKTCRECEFNNVVYVVKDNNNCKDKLAIDVKKIDIGDLIKYSGFTEEYIKECIRTSRINHNNWKLAQKVNKFKTKYNKYLHICRQLKEKVDWNTEMKCGVSRKCIHKAIYMDCINNNQMLPPKFQFRNYIESIYHQLNHKKHLELCLKESYNDVFNIQED